MSMNPISANMMPANATMPANPLAGVVYSRLVFAAAMSCSLSVSTMLFGESPTARGGSASPRRGDSRGPEPLDVAPPQLTLDAPAEEAQSRAGEEEHPRPQHEGQRQRVRDPRAGVEDVRDDEL